MARERKPMPPAHEPLEQEEMTVVVVKFKGGPESMQKGFEAVNNAIAVLGPTPNSHQRVVITRTPAQLPAAPQRNGDSDVIDSEIERPEPEVQEGDIATPASIAPAPPPKSRVGYTFMSEFNLSPANVPSWKEYATQKNPQTVNEQYLVASAWIQTHGGIDSFTGRHLFTTFRAMEWKTQVDMTQPLRFMKSKKSYFESPSKGNWKLTGIGLEAAEKIGK